jgi:4-amino-4-deoxy-L-arabinose transferase-like glycosyltransferase
MPARRQSAVAIPLGAASRAANIAGANYAALALILAFYLLYGLGAYGILNDNEGLYAEGAREMLASGSFGVPTLNGVPYLEKPPLLYWLLAAAYALFGESQIVARAVPVAASALLVWGTVAFVRRRAGGERTAWLAGLILASSFFQALIFRTVLPDVLLAITFALAMFSFFAWHQHREKASLLASCAWLGTAVLAKGFVAIALAALVLAGFAAVVKRSWRWRDLARGPGCWVLLALVAAWPLYLALTHWEYAWFYVVNEHLLRFFGLREPHDYYTGPLYYYLPRILVALFPWTLFLPLLVARRPASELEKFCWLWFGACLVFFSLSSAKGNYYMTVAMAPLAILLAARISEALEANRQTLFILGSALLAAALCMGVLALDAKLWTPTPKRFWIAVFAHQDFLKASLLVVAAIGALALVLFVGRLQRAALYALAAINLPLLLLFASAATKAEPYLSQDHAAQYLRAHHRGAHIFLFQDYEKLVSLPFYLKREIPVVDSRSNDLAFGMMHAAGSAGFLSAEEFAALCSAERVVLVVHRDRREAYRETLGEIGLAPRARIGNITLYAN